LEHIVDTQRLAKHVCTTCGIKRHFGYVYHRPGQVYDRREGLQFGTSARDENHWFRQDIDAYLHNLAVHYGVVPRQKTKVTSLEIDTQGVKLQRSTGEEIRARYLVDGTGHRSILAERFGLRESPTRLVSVGMTIEPRRDPKPHNSSAEHELNEFVRRYPSVAEQLKDGKAVRTWVSTGRLQ